MKNKYDDMIEEAKNAIEDTDADSRLQQRALDLVKKFLKSNFPVFDALGDFEADYDENERELNITMYSVTIYKDDDEDTLRHELTLYVKDSEYLLTDDENYIQIKEDSNNRTALFRFGKDIIGVEGIKQNGDNEYSTVKVGVYVDALYTFYCLNDIEEHDPDYSEEYSSVDEGRICAEYLKEPATVKGYYKTKALEDSIDLFLRFGIMYRNWLREKEINIFREPNQPRQGK